VAVPSTLIEVVRRVPTDEVEQAYASGGYAHGRPGAALLLARRLLQHSARADGGRTQPVVVVRSAAQRVALHVDEVLGNQEVVVKHLGPQLARLPGLAGVTLLPLGRVALIYNPVALATLYGDRRSAVPCGAACAGARADAAEPGRPWHRRRWCWWSTIRSPCAASRSACWCARATASCWPRTAWTRSRSWPKSGRRSCCRTSRCRAWTASTWCATCAPTPRLAGLPVVMITSRIAQKHRDYAAELGVDHYLGKPYSEDELLRLVARYPARVSPDRADVARRGRCTAGVRKAAFRVSGIPEAAENQPGHTHPLPEAMSEVVDHLAELTGFRDRDVLDVTLVGAFRDLLRPDSVAIYRPVGEPGRPALADARPAAAHELAPRPTPSGPISTTCRRWRRCRRTSRCLQQQARIVQLPAGQVHLTLFPLNHRPREPAACSRSAPCRRSSAEQRLVIQHPAHLPQLPGPAGLQRARHAHRPAQPQDLRRLVPARGRVPGRRCRRRGDAEDRRTRAALAAAGWGDRHRPLQARQRHHGHLIGDEVLLLLARLMRASFRFDDRLYRFGGEEFVVLMRCTGAGRTGGWPSSGCAATSSAYLSSRRSATSRCRIGFTELRAATRPAGAFERADKAVYFAKQNGRNQVGTTPNWWLRGTSKRRQDRRHRAVLASPVR
jgi:CheY-like chemotaxis protein